MDEKIRSLFSRRQLDGSTYDTYMLYYSGLTLADGSFVLAGRCILLAAAVRLT